MRTSENRWEETLRRSRHETALKRLALAGLPRPSGRACLVFNIGGHETPQGRVPRTGETDRGGARSLHCLLSLPCPPTPHVHLLHAAEDAKADSRGPWHAGPFPREGGPQLVRDADSESGLSQVPGGLVGASKVKGREALAGDPAGARLCFLNAVPIRLRVGVVISLHELVLLIFHMSPRSICDCLGIHGLGHEGSDCPRQ